MSLNRIAVLCASLLLTVATVHAQTNVRVRGTITAIDATTLSVKSREGKDVRMGLTEATTVAFPKALRLEDIKDGDFVGTTTRARPDGTEVAIEIHFLPPTANAGQTPYDLEPKSKMINARVQAKVARTGDHEITLQYANEMQKVVVPDGTPIVRAMPGNRADLVTGEYVVVTAQAAADGALTALRVQVSKDGVRPPQ